MKNLLKISMVAFMAIFGFACHDDDPTAEKPSVEVGEVTLSADETSATVEVIPSGNATELHWSCTEEGGVSYENGTVTKGAYTITLPNIKLDTNYTLSVYSKNATGQSEVVTRPFIFKKEDILKELVEIKIKNLTTISMDVDITKSIKCSKYVITAIPKYEEKDITDDAGNVIETVFVERFDEASFIEQAERSVDAYQKAAEGDQSGDYLFAPYPVATQSGSFGEHNLVKAANMASNPDYFQGMPVEAGAEYVIEVYAYDAEGNGKVYTQEVKLPETSEVKGTANISIEFLNLESSYSKVTARISADAECTRIYSGISIPNEYDGGVGKDMREMSNAEFEKCVMSLYHGQSEIYTGPVVKEFKDNIEPGAVRVIWAIAIDKDGNIGKIDRAFFTAPTYLAKGKGKITSAVITNSDDKKRANITVTVDDNAKKVRLLSINSENWSSFSRVLDYTLYQTKEDGGGFYEEADVVNGQATFNPRFIEGSTAYYFIAATVDADGNVSPNQNLVRVATGTWTMTWDVPQEGQVDLTYNGNGLLTATIKEQGMVTIGSGWDAEDVYKASFTVTKGDNAVGFYYVHLAYSSIEDLEADIADAANDAKYVSDFEDYYSDMYFSFDNSSTVEVADKGAYSQFRVAYGENGGGLVAFISKDADGNLKIVSVYKAGGASQEGTIVSYSK